MKGGVDSAGGTPRRRRARSTRRTSSWRRSTRAPRRRSRAILVKGAPDRLLERSRTQRGADGPRAARPRRAGRRAIDELELRRACACSRRRASRCGRRHRRDRRSTTSSDLEFLGLVGHRRPAAARGDRGDRGLPRRRHPREDDHRRPRRHGRSRSAARWASSRATTSRVLTGAELEALSQEQLQARSCATSTSTRARAPSTRSASCGRCSRTARSSR